MKAIALALLIVFVLMGLPVLVQAFTAAWRAVERDGDEL